MQRVTSLGVRSQHPRQLPAQPAAPAPRPTAGRPLAGAQPPALGWGGGSRGEVRILHGVQVVDGVAHPGLQQPGLRGGQEAVAQVTEGGVVTVQVMEKGLGT